MSKYSSLFTKQAKWSKLHEHFRRILTGMQETSTISHDVHTSISHYSERQLREAFVEEFGNDIDTTKAMWQLKKDAIEDPGIRLGGKVREHLLTDCSVDRVASIVGTALTKNPALTSPSHKRSQLLTAGSLAYGFRRAPRPQYKYLKPRVPNLAVLYTGLNMLTSTWKKQVIDFLSGSHSCITYGKLMHIANATVNFTIKHHATGPQLPPNCCTGRWACISFDNYDVKLRSGEVHYVCIAAYQNVGGHEVGHVPRVGGPFYRKLLMDEGFTQPVASEAVPSCSADRVFELPPIDVDMTEDGSHGQVYRDELQAEENVAVDDVFQDSTPSTHSTEFHAARFNQQVVDEHGLLHVHIDLRRSIAPNFTG